MFYVQLSTVKGRPPPKSYEPVNLPKYVPSQLLAGITMSGGFFPTIPQGNQKALTNILLGDDGGWRSPYEGLQPPGRLALGAWGPSIPIVFRKCRDGLKIPILGIYIPTLRDKLRWLAGKWTLNESMYIIISY